MIPNNDEIDAAFKALAVRQTVSGLRMDGTSNQPDSLNESEPFGCFGCHIGFQNETKLSLESVFEVVRRELESNSHAFCGRSYTSSRQLAKMILALAAILKPDDIRSGLSELFASITVTDAELYAISMDEIEDTRQYRFGDFLYGPLNFERLEHFDSLAKAVRLRPKLSKFDLTQHNRKSLTLFRRLTDIKTIHPVFANEVRNDLDELILGQWLNEYHNIVASQLWRDFRVDFVGQQSLAASCGVRSIPSRRFFGDSYSTCLVTAFYKKKSDFVFLAAKDHVSDDDDEVVPSELEKAWNKVAQYLGLNDWGNFKIDEDLGRYCEYIQKAERYRITGNSDEALVHYVFGLDFLLGGEKGEPLTLVVSERVASIASPPLGQEFPQIAKLICVVYNARSGYAHRGEKIDAELKPDDLNRLGDIVRIVLAAACYARKQLWCDGKKSWLDRIDVIRAKRRVKDAKIDEECRELGIGLIYKPEKASCFAIRWSDAEEGDE